MKTMTKNSKLIVKCATKLESDLVLCFATDKKYSSSFGWEYVFYDKKDNIYDFCDILDILEEDVSDVPVISFEDWEKLPESEEKVESKEEVNIIDDWLDKYGDKEIEKQVKEQVARENEEREKRKEIIIEMMQADEEDGLYEDIELQADRFNDGKLRFDLINPYAQEELAKILTFGSKKYGDRNWEKGMNWTSVVASLKRHLNEWEKGVDYDKESGELHVSHMLANIHMLVAYQTIYKIGDDRPKRF